MTKHLQFDHSTASEYDRGIRRTLPTYDTMFRLVQAHLTQKISNNSDLLIVGAGGGTEISTLGAANATWHFTAVDPSTAMVRLAEDKIQHTNLQERVNLLVGTIENVEEDLTFDAATCLLVLHFIKDDAEKLQQLIEIRKRLKPGAPFVLSAMFGDTKSAAFSAQFNLWKAYWLDNTSLSEQQVQEMGEEVLELSFLTEEEIIRLLEMAGFANISSFFTTTIFGGWICEAT